MRVRNFFMASDFAIDALSRYAVAGLASGVTAIPSVPFQDEWVFASLVEFDPAEMGTTIECEFSVREPGSDWRRLGGMMVASSADYESFDDGTAWEWYVNRVPLTFAETGTYNYAIRLDGEVLASTRLRIRLLAG